MRLGDEFKGKKGRQRYEQHQAAEWARGHGPAIQPNVPLRHKNVLPCLRRGSFLNRNMKILSCFAILLLCLGVSARGADQIVVLKAARMFDGKSKTLVQNPVVIVQGDKIVDVGANLSAPEGAKVVDLGDATLSPGFMDAHTHLTLDFSGNFNQLRLDAIDLNVSEHAIKATTYA